MENPETNDQGMWKNIIECCHKHRYGLIILLIIAATS